MIVLIRVPLLFFAFVMLLLSVNYSVVIAQEPASTDDIEDQLIKLLKMTDKELMILQGLAEVPLSEEQLTTIDQQGYIENVTETGAVISSLGNDINCYLETRYLLNERTRYDEAKNALIGNFYPDKRSRNIICSSFSRLSDSTRCTITENQTTTDITDTQLLEYHQICINQIANVFKMAADNPQ